MKRCGYSSGYCLSTERCQLPDLARMGFQTWDPKDPAIVNCRYRARTHREYVIRSRLRDQLSFWREGKEV